MAHGIKRSRQGGRVEGCGMGRQRERERLCYCSCANPRGGRGLLSHGSSLWSQKEMNGDINSAVIDPMAWNQRRQSPLGPNYLDGVVEELVS